MPSPFTLVSIFITLLFASVVCIQGVLVNDTDGNPVTTHDQYFIQPVNNGVGLFPFPTIYICPFRIAVIPSVTGPPVSFSFIPPWIKKSILDTYSQVTIEYKPQFWPLCTNSTKFWTVDVSSSEASDEPAILVSGYPTRTNSWFQIRTAGANTYELATKSGTVGTIPMYWWVIPPRLVLTNDTARTLFVKFKKLDAATTATY